MLVLQRELFVEEGFLGAGRPGDLRQFLGAETAIEPAQERKVLRDRRPECDAFRRQTLRRRRPVGVARGKPGQSCRPRHQLNAGNAPMSATA
jgi:hypothetical protein